MYTITFIVYCLVCCLRCSTAHMLNTTALLLTVQHALAQDCILSHADVPVSQFAVCVTLLLLHFNTIAELKTISVQ
jgi:hypothetical protein